MNKKYKLHKSDKYVRLAAEYENYRKRTQREKSALYDDAVCDVVSKILTIGDSLVAAAQYDDKGTRMILQNFIKALESLGVECYGAIGDEFNPFDYNAIEQSQGAHNKVTKVYQMGYKIKNKIIRPAAVAVGA